MDSIKYIGMDVHSATISIAVRNAAGKLTAEATIETRAASLIGFLRGQDGPVQVAFEEGVHAAWLCEILRPHVSRIVVCDARQLPRHKGERRNDKIDARQLSEWLRLGSLKPVYHGHNGLQALRECAHSYLTLVSDTTRVMNRLKAIYRGRGIAAPGARVYSPLHRADWIEQLREPGVRHRAALLYAQLDGLLPLRQQAKRSMITESRKHVAQKILSTIPTLGPVRVAVLMAILQTPWRFRTNRHLWTYAGLGVVERSSGDYRMIGGQLTRSRRPALILGLNWNYRHDLKGIFKAAAASAAAQPGPFHEFYENRTARGMDPRMARLTVARKLATIVLQLWKKGERFNAEHLKPQAA